MRKTVLYIEESSVLNEGKKMTELEACYFPLPNEIIARQRQSMTTTTMGKVLGELYNGWIRQITLALISYGRCNKLPQTQWLTTAGMYSLIALETRSPKSVSLGGNEGVGRATLSLEALAEEFVPCLFHFWQLLVSPGSWLYRSNRCLLS